MTNVPLLRKVMEHIEENPEEWDQHHWLRRRANLRRPRVVAANIEEQRQEVLSCGTAYCFAGHTAFMTGWEPIFSPNALSFNGENMQKDGKSLYVGAIARIELDLSPEDADRLFRATNTRRDLRALVNKYIAEEEAKLDA